MGWENGVAWRGGSIHPMSQSVTPACALFIGMLRCVGSRARKAI